MTNEQLVEKVMKLELANVQFNSETKRHDELIHELQEDVKATKTLAEDVHIMALNMESMQKTLTETNKKVDNLINKDYNEFQEHKRIFKEKLLSGIYGGLATAIIGAIVFFINTYIKGGV